MSPNEVAKMLSLVNLSQSIGDLLVFGLAYYFCFVCFECTYIPDVYGLVPGTRVFNVSKTIQK